MLAGKKEQGMEEGFKQGNCRKGKRKIEKRLRRRSSESLSKSLRFFVVPNKNWHIIQNELTVCTNPLEKFQI